MTKELIRPDYYHIPATVAELVQPHEAFVWSVVYWFEKMKDGRCIASNQRIADSLPYKSTASSVGNALLTLEEKGLITRIFSDDQKRIRKEIKVTVKTLKIPAKGYHPQVGRTEKVPPTGGTGTTHRCDGVPPTGEQNSKREILKEPLVVATRSHTPTPSENCELFFSGVLALQQGAPADDAKAILTELVERTGIEKAALWNEVRKFTDYWTEREKNGKRQRWQMEKTFEVDRRLSTWLKRSYGTMQRAKPPSKYKAAIV
jgi:hypothetical protein